MHSKHCLYYKGDKDGRNLILVLRQVDDFIISANLLATTSEIKAQIQSKMTNPLNDLDIIQRFNGVDIQQTRHYVNVDGWLNLLALNTPIPSNTGTYRRSTDEKQKQALEQEMGFSYRQVIGEAIFTMTICQIDISPAIIKLLQYLGNPAKCHYQALKNLFVFLNATKGERLYYW
jgi:hypothetical protein